MTIGKNIADLRKSNGMTQEQLAETLGVSSQTVSKWENEVTMPDIMLLPVIAGCFDITVDELYGGRKTIEKRQTIDYDDIPEMLYDAVIDLTQRGWVDTVEGKDIEAEKEKMKLISLPKMKLIERLNLLKLSDRRRTLMKTF